MFDVEFVVPVCGRFSSRLADFKKYGLVKARKAKQYTKR